MQNHPQYKLIVAANRDEFYSRPTASAQWWNDSPNLLAGKDLLEGGTWMGITKSGKFAAITNYRDSTPKLENSPSRGFIVKDYLTGNMPSSQFLKELDNMSLNYNGFNLVIGDINQIYFYSNRQRIMEPLKPGIYGLSNTLLNIPWFKVTRGTRELEQLLLSKLRLKIDNLLPILQDREMAPEYCLPDTGINKEWERILSPIFISSRRYGTYSSTVLMVDKSNEATFFERTYKPPSDIHHSFRIQTIK